MEARIAREQSGIKSPSGWFHEIIVNESPIFVPKATIRLGKLTLVVGGNGSGKTAVCEWLLGLGDPSFLWRWDDKRTDQPSLNLELTYFDPEKHSARIEILEKDSIKYYLDEREVPFYPLKLGVVHLQQFVETSAGDELQLISDILVIPPSTVRSLLPLVNRHNEGSVRNIRLVEANGAWNLLADHEGESNGLSFRQMSHSQRAKILPRTMHCKGKIYFRVLAHHTSG
jgi:energy-coupling factor transporter ATP-binding protein EcfA2